MLSARATSSRRLLVGWLLLLSAAGCGRIGVELLSIEDDARDGGMGSRSDGGNLDGGDAGLLTGAVPVDPGETDVCVDGQCASEVDRCPDTSRDWGGICGCDGSDVDTDRDGTPDCVDLCLDSPDRIEGPSCGCSEASEDNDQDGVENCSDLCANDPDKTLPGICGCNASDADADDDGMPDCGDPCPSDPTKIAAGACGCGVPETDTDSDGMPDCVDACSGLNDASYQPIADCGMGYCQTTNTPSSCLNGVETACQPGSPLSGTDATCDGIDDDCNGATDDGYAIVSQCGLGYCRSMSTASSCVGGVETACQPATALSGSDTTCNGVDDDCSGSTDEDYVSDNSCGVGYCRLNNTPSSCTGGVESTCQAATRLSSNDTTADGIDDDCDGQVDEDACVPRSDTYGVGAHTLASAAGCTHVTVKLWGGAGATGSNDGGEWGVGVTGGQGGAGGYAESAFTVNASTVLQLAVGQGGQGCGAGSSANASYRGGAGGNGNGVDGSAGADGSVTGGSGASPSSGGRGGNGSFGGGGGGSGARLYSSSGRGGDGGAATVLSVDGTRSMVAGGGAGGGGAGTTLIASGVSGGSGGVGCSGNGATAASQGGGGGGGGVCQGTTTQAGSGRTPYDQAALPAGVALGGPTSADCGRGGDGYAIVTYAP